jgi:hypothetical protein
VELTWDETNPERSEINQKLMSGQVDGITETDLRDYLASSSGEESDGNNWALLPFNQFYFICMDYI